MMSQQSSGSMRSPKKRLSQIHIPPRPERLVAAPPPPDLRDNDAEWLAKSDPLKCPAGLVLLKAEEAQRNRKQAETRLALEKIHDRIQYTLNDFEGPLEEAEKRKSDVNLEVVEDPAQLYDLLSDSRLRSKYQQNFTVFIVGYEEKCENRERVLTSLQEFFEETQSGGTQSLLDELESEEIDFDEVTSGLESAMDTAQNAAEKLLKIKKDMSQLIAIVAAYPDTKKGRKKLEKALLKAQEEVDGLTTSLNKVRSELEQNQERSEQIQKQLDIKTQECAKLRPMADKTKLLQVSNDSLKKEVTNLQASLAKAEEDLMEAKKRIPTKKETFAKAAAVVVDQGKINQLETKLAEERERNSSLKAEMEAASSEHQAALESLRAQHEVEIQEMRGRYEEQMKSLMEDDLFGDIDEEGGEEGEMMEGEEGQHLGDEESFPQDIGDEGGEFRVHPLTTTTMEQQMASEDEPPTADLADNTGTPPDRVTMDTNEEMIAGAHPQHISDIKDDTIVEGEISHDPHQCGDKDDQGSPPNQQEPQQPPHSSETTPIGTPPHKPRPSSPPTSTAGSGSSAGSVASSVKGRRMSKAVVGKIQKEFESREKKLKHDLEEVKAKSRKAVTSLKAQLADAHTKHEGEMEAVRREMRELEEHLEQVERENASLSEEVEGVRRENELALSLRDRDGQVYRYKSLAEEQRHVLAEPGSQGQRSDTTSLNEAMLKQQDLDSMLRGSPQWSEQSGGQLTPRSVGAAPILPMKEVFHSSGDDGQSLASGSVALPMADGLRQFMGTPLDQSLNSAIDHAPLGSPLQSASLAGSDGDGGGGRGDSVMRGRVVGGVAPPTGIPMQYSFSMLAQSRLSHHSSGPQAQLGFDHPVVLEWSKAYDTVIKFKDNLVNLLSQAPPTLAAMADDLRTLELHSLDRSGGGADVQGQITEMRFSLALMLHQIEQTLQDTLAETLGTSEDTDSPHSVDGGRGQTAGPQSDIDVEEFKVTVSQLKSKLREKEEHHRIAIQESKEMIADLSSKMETLKMEMATLRQTLPQHITGGGQGAELVGGANIMFTRLDAERNTRTLQGALEKERISPSLFHSVTSNMADYLTIPGQRLAMLADRCRGRELASSLLHHVSTDAFLVSEQGSKVIEGIAERERERQLRFSIEMDHLTAKRASLAHNLTHTLTHIEKKARVFLIKPIYACHPRGIHGGGRLRALITPIDRPLPLQQKPHPSGSSGSHPRTRGSGRGDGSRCGTPHPSMRLVSQLVKARKLQQSQTQWQIPPTSAGSPPPSTRRHMPPNTPTPAGLTTEWYVGESRIPPQSKDPEGAFGDADHGLLLPKIMELDILRKRQTDALLGHLLPDLISCPSSKGPPLKLKPLPDDSGAKGHVTTMAAGNGLTPSTSQQPVNQLKTTVHFDLYQRKSGHHAHLPPIQVPSRTDHDRPLPVP